MPSRLLVEKTDGKRFRITVPDGSKVTFGPWSPPTGNERNYNPNEKSLAGTLRVYESSKSGASVLAVFSNVRGYRNENLEYEEELLVEKGSTIWDSDRDGYKREERVKRSRSFDPQLTSGTEEQG